MSEPSWRQEDVFPGIARLIAGLCSGENFVTHARIVDAMLDDPELSGHIAEAHLRERSHSLRWLASNMSAWFSQRITAEASDWVDRFDRVKVDDEWAYRPKSGE